MYLSRLLLNLRNRFVRRDLADAHEMHRTIMSAFPQADDPKRARAEQGVLYRVESSNRSALTTLLVQSLIESDWSGLSEGYLLEDGSDNPATKSIANYYDALQDRQFLRFRLRANPTRKIDTKSGPGGQRRNGRRVEIRDELLQLEWLSRKGEQFGFKLVSALDTPGIFKVSVSSRSKEFAKQDAAARRVTTASVLFDGLLQIVDIERFLDALRRGIGPAKAYGCGMLSIARA